MDIFPRPMLDVVFLSMAYNDEAILCSSTSQFKDTERWSRLNGWCLSNSSQTGISIFVRSASKPGIRFYVQPSTSLCVARPDENCSKKNLVKFGKLTHGVVAADGYYDDEGFVCVLCVNENVFNVKQSRLTCRR